MSERGEESSRQRNTFADAIRGVAAVLVICGHVFASKQAMLKDTYVFWDFLYSIHMPIFFLIAGCYAFNGMKKGVGEFIRQKALRLLVPYVAWSTVAVAAKAVLSCLQGELDPAAVCSMWIDTLLYATSMWFFIALFHVQVAFRLLHKIAEKNKIVAVIVGIILYLIPLPNILAIHQAQTLMPYFVVGMLAMKHKEILTAKVKENKWLYGIAVLVCLLAPIYAHAAREWRFALGWQMVAALLMSVICTSAIILLFDRLFSFSTGLRKLFALFGRYSMELYCIHMMFVGYLPLPIPAALLNVHEVALDVYVFLIAIVIGLICVGLSWGIFNRIPIYRNVMLGQWKQKVRKEEQYGYLAK